MGGLGGDLDTDTFALNRLGSVRDVHAFCNKQKIEFQAGKASLLTTCDPGGFPNLAAPPAPSCPARPMTADEVDLEVAALRQRMGVLGAGGGSGGIGEGDEERPGL